jgi:hypothetical protein
MPLPLRPHPPFVGNRPVYERFLSSEVARPRPPWHSRRRFTIPAMTELARILPQIDEGDPHPAEQLLPLVYDELQQLANDRLAHEKPGQTLQRTALVYEAYLRLVGGDPKQLWSSCDSSLACDSRRSRHHAGPLAIVRPGSGCSPAPGARGCGGTWSGLPIPCPEPGVFSRILAAFSSPRRIVSRRATWATFAC